MHVPVGLKIDLVATEFGAEARYHTCSADGMDAAQLVDFLAARGKFRGSEAGFTVAADRKLAGINLAFIGRPAQYHAPSSTPQALDQGSVQHIGSQALEMADDLLRAPTLPQATQNAVYADVFGLFVVQHSPMIGWLLLTVAALATAFAAWGGFIASLLMLMNEVGKVREAIDTLRDFEIAFDGIDLDRIDAVEPRALPGIDGTVAPAQHAASIGRGHLVPFAGGGLSLGVIARIPCSSDVRSTLWNLRPTYS